MGRTNIAVDDAVAEQLSFEAGRENKTQYALANESLLSVLEVTKDGGSPKQIYPSWKFVSMMKDVGCLVLPEDLLEKLIGKMYDIDKDWLLKAWYDEGRRLGDFLKMSAVNPEDLAKVIEEFQVLLPAQKIEFKKITGIKDSTRYGGSTYEIRAMGAGSSLESTACADQFIRGILSSYSLNISESKLSRGIISIKATETRATL
ncbi:MAG: hypothetical protein PXY39_12395 [archaeon]|nr:hypothetical protein [archaeon]